MLLIWLFRNINSEGAINRYQYIYKHNIKFLCISSKFKITKIIKEVWVFKHSYLLLLCKWLPVSTMSKFCSVNISNLSQIFNVWHKDICCVLLYQVTLSTNCKIGINVICSFSCLLLRHYRWDASLLWFLCNYSIALNSSHSFLLFFWHLILNQKIFIDDFLKAQFIITNDFNYNSEEPFVTKRSRNEKRVQKASMCCISMKCSIIGILFTSIQIRNKNPVLKKKVWKIKMLYKFSLGVIFLGKQCWTSKRPQN